MKLNFAMIFACVPANDALVLVPKIQTITSYIIESIMVITE